MFKTLKSLFEPSPAAAGGTDRLALAAAVLMVEAARLDESVSAEERGRIQDLLRERFALPADEVAALVAEAERLSDSHGDWHRFTSQLRDAFDEAERVRLVEMLWDVVYADGELHHLESSLLRRVGGLLYVSDRDRGAARQRVLDRLGLPRDGEG
jgi:uncharacterized tellurite resistance protein B-like protein